MSGFLLSGCCACKKKPKCGSVGTDTAYPNFGLRWGDLHEWIDPHVETWKHDLMNSTDFVNDIADLKVIIGGFYGPTTFSNRCILWDQATQWGPLKDWLEAGGRLCVLTSSSDPPPDPDTISDAAVLADFLSYLGSDLERTQSTFDGGVCPLISGTPKTLPQWASPSQSPPDANLAQGLANVYCRGSSHVSWQGLGSNPVAVVLRSQNVFGWSCVVEKIGDGFLFLFGDMYFAHNISGVGAAKCYPDTDNKEFWRRLLCYGDEQII